MNKFPQISNVYIRFCYIYAIYLLFFYECNTNSLKLSPASIYFALLLIRPAHHNTQIPNLVFILFPITKDFIEIIIAYRKT